MSTAITRISSELESIAPPSAGPTPAEPIGYGFREFVLPDGVEEMRWTPLTWAQRLHPREGDQMPQGLMHLGLVRYLAFVLNWRLRHRPGVQAIFDTLMDLELAYVPPVAADVAVIQHPVDWPDWPAGTLMVDGRDIKVLMAMEVTSPGGEDNDKRDKFEIYHAAEIPTYVIIDTDRDRRVVRSIQTFHWTPKRYEAAPPDALDRHFLPVVDAHLQLRADHARCGVVLTDAKTGKLADPGSEEERTRKIMMEIVDRKDKEIRESRQKLRKESQARRDAEEARSRTEQARQQAEQARVQAEQALARERQTLEQERQARQQAEQARTMEAEARLRTDQELAEMKRLLEKLQADQGRNESPTKRGES